MALAAVEKDRARAQWLVGDLGAQVKTVSVTQARGIGARSRAVVRIPGVLEGRAIRICRWLCEA